MIYKQIQNTSFLLDYAGGRFLVDPAFRRMDFFGAGLGTKVSLGELLDVDAVLVTHLSDTSFDGLARQLLPRGIKIFVPSTRAVRELEKAGFSNVEVLQEHVHFQFVDLYRVPAYYGKEGEARKSEKGCGVILSHPVLNSIYLTGESVWYDGMKKTIKSWKPRLIVVQAGGVRRLDGSRLSMVHEEIAAVHLALPRAKIIANQNVWEGDRDSLRNYLYGHRMEEAVLMPKDGEEYRL
ncbi:MAG: hypothetical protein Q4F41_17205 [Eubacteriales bacterium]|nr:hypothetical protein [Eubacteriales bacterium]